MKHHNDINQIEAKVVEAASKNGPCVIDRGNGGPAQFKLPCYLRRMSIDQWHLSGLFLRLNRWRQSRQLRNTRASAERQ